MHRFLALAALSLVAADWPQWLGPHRDGTTPEVVKPWTDAPKVLWRTEVGEGHGSPIVAGGRVYLMDKVPGKDEERVRDWDAVSGKERAAVIASWSRGPFQGLFGAGPRATPAISGGTLYAVGVTGDYTVQSLEPGRTKLTSFNLLQRFHAPNLRFGLSASPLVEGDKVIVPVGGKGAGVVAIDRTKNEEVWKATDDAASYSSPIAIDHAGRRAVVVLTAEGVVALDPKDGTLLWRHPFKDKLAESSTTPVKVGDLLIASSVTLGSVALRLVEKDGKPAVEEAWKNGQLSCYFSTPAAVGDHLYMVTGSIFPPPTVTLRCVEAKTGKVVWSKPKVGKYHAALLRTGDGKLLMHTDLGELALIDPSPDGYKELAKSKVCGETWAHPAIADGRLYLRDAKELLCLQLTSDKRSAISD